MSSTSIPAAAIQGCAEGVLETIDWAKVGIDRSKFTGGDIYDCAVPTILYATVIAYDKDKLPNGPTKIADLFDLQKFPGKRALQKDPFVNLEWALIADGVAIKDVYKVLGTPEGVDRAFKKLDTIKKDVVWWEAGAQPPQLLADGSVVMTSSWNGRIYDANKNSGKHFEIMWDAQGLDWDLWAIPKGDPRMDDAYKFIAFASSAGRAGGADALDPLWSRQQGRDPAGRSGDPVESADGAGSHDQCLADRLRNSGATRAKIFASASRPGWPSKGLPPLAAGSRRPPPGLARMRR